jgi:L-histidine N-alpha-methyltransferase
MPDSSAATRLPEDQTDLHLPHRTMQEEVVAGLSQQQKALPCKLFYDQRGSDLFDRICELDEYYPTRTEVAILDRRAPEIAHRLGRDVRLIEVGSGSSNKTHVLLRALEAPHGYVPIDIARDHLEGAAERIRDAFPDLEVWPVCADFNAPFELPDESERDVRNVVFFPGSTIGNLDERGRHALLARLAELCESPGGSLVIGIDLVKDRKSLEAAYNDAEGVTAAFNLNVLRHINRELGANFAVDQFEHRAFFDTDRERIEMHLVSAIDQEVEIDGHSFRFESGETICTEHSYKFTIDGFRAQAERSGWALDTVWTDDRDRFAIMLLNTSPSDD